MPVYEYECRECGKVHEVWQSMNDAPLASCPDCSGEVYKIISQSSFHLKGGGWYADGYSKGAAKNNGGCNGKDGGAKKGDSCPAKSESSCGCCA